MKDKVVFTFGRFNPPTVGHEKLLNKVFSVASKESADFLVFPSHSQNPKKDPLDFRSKVKFMKKMFPKYSKNIMSNNKVKNAFNAVSLLHELGYKEVIMVVGGDRVSEFTAILNKYNGIEGKHGFYDFEAGIKVVSAGERDPDSEGVSGMSASKMRAAAAADDYDSFKNGLPARFRGGELLFTMLRRAMKVEETELGIFLGSDVHTFREFIDSPVTEMIDVFDEKELIQEFYLPAQLKKKESPISGFKHFLPESMLPGNSGPSSLAKYENIDWKSIDEMFDNYPWLSRAAEKIFKRSRYKAALKFFLQTYDQDPNHSVRYAFERSWKYFNLRPRRFKDFLEDLIQQGLLPAKYSF